MPIITLTTDFGIKDHFIGAVKGAIYSELPDANIVDITHQISPFNITETAYILRNAYKSFPNGTIHIVWVDAEFSKENNHIAIELDNQYFICPNNGLISMIAAEIVPTKIVEINFLNHINSSFPEMEIFIKVAAHIARGGNLNIIGKETQELKKLVEIQPKTNQSKNMIRGGVIYIDNYGNVITNINKNLFTTIGKDRKFTITAGRYKFHQVYKSYNSIIDYDIPKEKRQYDGEKLAIFNSAGFLEIAIYKSNLKTVGGASTLLGLKYRDTIIVEFDEIVEPEFISINQ